MEKPTAHILFVSFTGQGHLNPFIRFAKTVASKGADVTFSCPADAGHRIRAAIRSSAEGDTAAAAAADGVFTAIGSGRIRFEFFSDGWEVGDPRRYDLDLYMPQLKEVASAEIAALLRRQAELGRPVSCVVSNPFIPWVMDVAGEMGIPRAVLWVQSVAVFSAYFHYHRNLVEFPSESKPDLTVELPGVPVLDPQDVPSFLMPGNPFPSLTTAILAQFSNVEDADWVFANSCEEMESEAIAGIAGHIRVIPVGPLVEPPARTGSVRGDLWKAADCESWLDGRDPGSVVYAAFGSIVILSAAEVVEMAEGLRACGQPFIWVVRDDARVFLPEGFEEDVADRGMVVQWSPQEAVLRHPATACFITHCGWNSTLECLTAGVPAIAFPQWGDQVTDAKFLLDVFQMGVHLKPSKAQSFTREDVSRAVAEVVHGPRAGEMRANAAKYKELTAAAVAPGGSSDRHVAAFVEEIVRRVEVVQTPIAGRETAKISKRSNVETVVV
ncbi:gallate 1-beta-glucosyltransferase-like [Wolffia australiana]